jgi:hypothetical protein
LLAQQAKNNIRAGYWTNIEQEKVRKAMAYDLHHEKSYPLDAQSVYQAALKVAEKLQGKLIASNPEKMRFEANFPKVILGSTLGERTFCSCEVQPQAEGSLVVLDAYPLDALNRKLIFGARKGVTQTLIAWFTAHLEHNLGIPEK